MTRIDPKRPPRDSEKSSSIDLAIQDIEDLANRLHAAREEEIQLEKKTRTPEEQRLLEAKRAEIKQLEIEQARAQDVMEDSQGLAASRALVGARGPVDEKAADAIRDAVSKADPALKSEVDANRVNTPPRRR